MKKKVVVITHYSSRAGESYRQTLKTLFNDMLDIDTVTLVLDKMHEIEADLILVTAYSLYMECKKYIKNDSEVLLLSYTITKEALEKVNKIPKGQKVMLVNSSADRAMDSVALLYQLGVDHIEIIPVYPGMTEPPAVDIAISPDEDEFVPEWVKQTINIGNRVMDISTVVDIAMKLELGHMLLTKPIQDYFNRIMQVRSGGIKKLLGKNSQLSDQLDILLQIVDDGLIGVYANGIIYFCNEAAESIIGHKRSEVVGSYIHELIQQAIFQEVIEHWKPIKNHLIKIQGVDVVVSAHPFSSMEERLGIFIMLKKYRDTEKQQHRIRIQATDKGHVAKYTFEDIVGESKVIKTVKELAQGMAKSNSSVLIRGESGTGKELFAQAIHNASSRKKYPFIAVNCAALPENLLESELFGYEEGAFTGAKKGGKMGYFEMAHMGTLFLDEIGDMSPSLQVRLLRTIQEREIVRIAGDSVIKVDVRIIAATNRDLKKMVHTGEFRKDLYYRLNVLPLNIPPLSERIDDIPLLVKHIAKSLNVNFSLTSDVTAVLVNHDWEGNIRELHNYVEYLGQTGKEIIDMKDIWPILQTRDATEITNFEDIELDERLLKLIESNKVNYCFVLEQLERCYRTQSITGRRSLTCMARRHGIFLSEQQIRAIFMVLESYGIIDVLKGRGGTRLTEQGLNLVHYLERNCKAIKKSALP